MLHHLHQKQPNDQLQPQLVPQRNALLDQLQLEDQQQHDDHLQQEVLLTITLLTFAT